MELQFSVAGKIVHGDQLGRKLGFPTANLQEGASSSLPAADMKQGVYACVCFLSRDITASRIQTTAKLNPEVLEYVETRLKIPVNFLQAPYAGLLHYGTRSTFGEEVPRHEVYLFGFDADIYDHELLCYALEFLRPSQKFAGEAELIAQMQKDKAQGEGLLLADTL